MLRQPGVFVGIRKREEKKLFFVIMILKIISLYDTVFSDGKVSGSGKENRKVRTGRKLSPAEAGTVRKT